ncbi:g1509 [Coccomyxa viridis]|uniref:G1509 protein n=1 Tax=Coccomyxa viridis TaxID=1274662 RepID=A0ABP1FI55_9CHLO
MAELPVTDSTMIAGLQADWEKETQRGSHEATQAAFRLVWGLVHSSNNKDVDRGLRFADELLRDKSLDAQDQRDLVYLTAVAMYKLGKVLDARRQLDELLRVNPQWRQAQTLKQAVDDQVVKEGLLGLGVATAIGGVAALILAAALGARR